MSSSQQNATTESPPDIIDSVYKSISSEEAFDMFYFISEGRVKYPTEQKETQDKEDRERRKREGLAIQIATKASPHENHDKVRVFVSSLGHKYYATSHTYRKVDNSPSANRWARVERYITCTVPGECDTPDEALEGLLAYLIWETGGGDSDVTLTNRK
ncbi:hypothetical protein P280DRAFT_286175 [Massarina eburnea CBS 473.64]|uniref:Uncharacterized protein n=1 Tax=Massarina eburnea CBS 473.64 TaxID=1395130 RepID=A0A6A6S2S0_9PLEO|nr:hypothetical protein P280DRAFT_286175 [Massarina eburnea CBS 473.64]